MKERRAIRYRGVLYQARERVSVDVVVFHEPEFQEPGWLLVPSQGSALLRSSHPGGFVPNFMVPLPRLDLVFLVCTRLRERIEIR